MNVTSIASPPAEIEIGGTTPSATTAPGAGTSVDFATLLAGLLEGMPSGLPTTTPEVSATSAAGVVASLVGEAAAPAEEAPEKATSDDETEAPASTSESDVPLLAAALVTTAPLPVVTLKPAVEAAPEDPVSTGAPPAGGVSAAAAPVTSATSTAIPATTVEVEAPPQANVAPSATGVEDEPAIDTRLPRVEVRNVVVTDVDTETSGPPAGFTGDVAARAGSSATYTIAPNPARVETARTQPAPEAVAASGVAAPVADVTPSTPVPVVATPTVATPVVDTTATSAVPAPTTVVVPLAATGTKPTVEATTDVDAPGATPAASFAAAETPEMTASTTAGQQHGGESSQRESPQGHTTKAAAPAAVPSPTLAPHAVVLAKNALNEQVRGASARELLAGARAVESLTDRPAERPVEAPGNAVVLAQPDGLARLSQRAGSEPITAFQSTLPSLGEDLVKHVSAHSTAGERTLTLRLTPESLGEVQVEIRSTAGELSVRLISQDDGVRSTLEQHVVGLRESLARDGRETRIEVGAHLTSNFGQAHDGAQLGRQAAQQDAQERPRLVPVAPYGDAPRSDSEPNPAQRRSNHHAGVLNLFA